MSRKLLSSRILILIIALHLVGVAATAIFFSDGGLPPNGPASATASTMTAALPVGYLRPAASAPGTWRCARCGRHVPAAQAACPLCGYPAHRGSRAPGMTPSDNSPAFTVPHAVGGGTALAFSAPTITAGGTGTTRAPAPPPAMSGPTFASPGIPQGNYAAGPSSLVALGSSSSTGGSAAGASTNLAARVPLGQTAPLGLLSPRAQQASQKEFIEGHWLGLEVIPLTPELAQEYLIPDGEQGVLVDEITLESAESGILAGDMVHAINAYPTPDLRAFFKATLQVHRERSAQVEVGRRGQILTFTIETKNAPQLGYAQMEAAQPIQPGAISPHRDRGRPCTNCHIIMAQGGQLPTDAGDILPNPPPITASTRAPHPYRGPCRSCHQITGP